MFIGVHIPSVVINPPGQNSQTYTSLFVVLIVAWSLFMCAEGGVERNINGSLGDVLHHQHNHQVNWLEKGFSLLQEHVLHV